MALSNKRVIANQCLLVALVLYIISAILIGTYPALGYLKAFAEAAIVGGIADWFAVTALFKHPLGLPIPHTAIVPKRKNEIGEGLGDPLPVGLVSDLRARDREVVLVVGVLDVGQEVPAPADQVEPPAKEIPGRAHLGRVDVGLGEGPAAKQGGDLQGIDLVVLGLPAVDGLHVEGMPEHELDALPSAEISEPVPREHALDRNDEVVSVRRHGSKEGLGAALDVLVEEDLALPVEDAEVHRLGV